VLLDDIADYLSSQGGYVVGTNLFKGVRPEKPDAMVAVYEVPGRPTVHSFNDGPGEAVEERPVVQVVARAQQDDYTAARLSANVVFRLLDGMPSRSINGVDYLWASARQSPFLMGRDEDHRVLVAFNVDICKRISTA
jgi:hypothetical protein